LMIATTCELTNLTHTYSLLNTIRVFVAKKNTSQSQTSGHLNTIRAFVAFQLHP